MLTVLDENIFDDPKNPYYITIDMLDEDWADDRIRYKLIRSLIDVVNRFKRLSNVKIIMSIRHDLLHKVLYSETSAGFQEEKFKSLYLNLKWEKKELQEIVKKRINKLISRRYTKGDVTFEDVFPKKIESKSSFDYLLDRTFFRPRDIIVFVNECLDLCAEKPQISATTIKEAEVKYSSERLQSLAHEWVIIFPDLQNLARLLYGTKEHFEVSSLTLETLQKSFEEISVSLDPNSTDPMTKQLNLLYAEKNANFESIRSYLLREFHHLGLIGIKTGPTDSVNWSRENNHIRMSAGQVRPSSTVYIHPMFHRVLGTRI